ncbi:hypothetical protein A8C32_05900 [Flavivirga aquatica]|uniref:Uncharacterized protein n=1 Tax=Flavivirga aquatica TaxID=1849968 RepID=A0A1E5SHY0_9FLAO|nr:hypothetical protein [Flavivirga aquatica]OEJ98729.1 hypothetical protein A8C32_05900 [Flavivirga aquatica]
MIKLVRIIDAIPNLGYLLFSAASLLIFLLTYFFNYNVNTLDITETASLIFGYSALGFIIKNGSFTKNKNKFFKFFLLSISVLLIGTVLKILHLNYSKKVFLLSFSLMSLSYSLYFVKKKYKLVLDYFK